MVTATEIKVDDLQPAVFIIEVLDKDQKEISGIKFNVSVDDGDATLIEVNDQGILKVPKPQNEIKLSLTSEESDTGQTENAQQESDTTA